MQRVDELINLFRGHTPLEGVRPLCVAITQAEFDEFAPLYDKVCRLIHKEPFYQRDTSDGRKAWWVSMGPGLIIEHKNAAR